MRIPAIALISILLSINASSVAAQSFKDRWSIIPKAHAEEPQDTDQRTSPVPPAQPPTETTGSAAANGCRKANPRRARWFDDWDLSGAAFPERHRLLVSFRKKRRAVRHSTQKREPPLIATSLRDRSACDQRRQQQVAGDYHHRPRTAQA